MMTLQQEIPLQVLNDKVSRKILSHADGLMIVQVSFKKGGIGEAHAHSNHEQIGYVVKGRFQVIVGDESRTLGQGDSFYASKNTRHGVVALEDSILLDIFTPQREDFLV